MSETLTLEALRDALPDAARDTKVNLGNVLAQGSLAPEQRWGTAVAAALAARSPEVARALIAAGQAAGTLPPEVLADAQAAASLMAMTNVTYRFKHLVGKPDYQSLPMRLRMMRVAQPASSKVNLELFSLAVSALEGCEACVASHEKVVTDAGLTPEQVFEAVRVAAVVNSAVTGLAIRAAVGQSGQEAR
jgi:alkyl hydroperoxide reductase subunit D